MVKAEPGAVKTESSPTQTPAPPPQLSNPATVNNSVGVNGSGTNAVGSTDRSLPTPSSATRSNAKDPSRPRRKKARRACFACQRAHLTCGDERPCQRCIKRGLQDACHDGVRKKAKYLHDAPIDDSPPEFAPHHTSTANNSFSYHSQLSQMPSVVTEMLPPDGTINPNSIESSGAAAMVEQAHQPQRQQQAFSQAPLFDPSDPALFNFDIASLNFGSHYGALEFGVLGQMSGNNGGVGTPDNNNSGPGSSYGYSPGIVGDKYVGFTTPETSALGDAWGTSRGSRLSDATAGTGGFANTYMIEAGPGSLTSPSPPIESPRQTYTPTTTTAIQTSQTYTTVGETPTASSSPSFFSTPLPPKNRPSHPSTLQLIQSAPTHGHQQTGLRRRRPDDPSLIYSTITQPYPYALQHHRLFHMLECRFPKSLLLRIARAMASFRPSFIACTQTLKAEDLLFMEKCFQRTLWEYERFIQSCGTPTIICRRTGEVVGVGKEFCMLTGWEKSILLGEKRNLNTNRPFAKPPGAPSGLLPPPDDDVPGGVKRAVFLAELLDDESVVEFYEQFARLAFGDSRGAVMTTCKVLAYQAPTATEDDEKGNCTKLAANGRRLGGKDGKVDCAFCWTIKRDVFDIPMLIVGNFLPILGKTSESG